MKHIKSGLLFLVSLVGLTLVFLGIFLALSKPHQELKSNATTPRIKKLNLVAVGDSLTHGVGDQTHKGGYVWLIKQRLQQDHYQVTTANFGKTGDRSDQIQARIIKQVNIQKTLKKADVITLTVGGNDLMKVLQDNFLLLASNQLDAAMPKAKKQYQTSLTSLLKTIRTYNSKAPIFLFSIYNPFYVYFPQITDLQKYTNQWNQLAQKVGQKSGNVYFVDINQQLSKGQYLHQPKEKLTQTTEVDLTKVSSDKLEEILSNQKEKNNYLSSDDHFHPNLKGYKYMTKQLYQVMQSHQKQWQKE